MSIGLRHHCIESLLRGLFIFVAIFVAGYPMYAAMIYQTIPVFTNAFTHANISLPNAFDKA